MKSLFLQIIQNQKYNNWLFPLVINLKGFCRTFAKSLVKGLLDFWNKSLIFAPKEIRGFILTKKIKNVMAKITSKSSRKWI